MLQVLTSSWWLLVVRGLLLIALAVLAFVNPGGTAQAFVMYAGILLMIEGVLTALVPFLGGANPDENRWLILLEGVLTALFGYLIFTVSAAVVVAFALLFGAWMVFSGVVKIALAIQLRKEIEGEFWLGLWGALGVLFGVAIFFQPGIGVATVITIVGIFALIAGIVSVALGFRLKSLQGRVREGVGQVRSALADATEKRQEK